MRLTLSQQDVYFEQLLFPNDPIYNIGAKIAISGVVNYATLNQAYQALIDQHDAYRSIIRRNGVEAHVEILPSHDTSLEFVDFSQNPQADEAANAFMQSTFKTVFNFDESGLLHKFILVKVSDTYYYLFSMYHHIITDGWGTSLMFQRLVANYNELMTSGGIESEYPYSYRDFVDDDLEYSRSGQFEKDKAYWCNRFRELPEPVFEPTSGNAHRHQSSREELIINRSLYNQVEQLAAETRCSTFHAILATLFLYFGLRDQKRDFAIGIPVLNRGRAVYKKTVGLFMGVSALRMAVDVEESFRDLLLKIKQQLRQDYRYQRFPLGKLIKELGLFDEKHRLFNITLSYEKQNYADHFHNTNTQVIPLTHESERVALAVYIREFDEREDVKIDLDYNIHYFSREDIQQLAGHLQKLLQEVVNAPDKKLLDHQYVTAEERRLLLYDFNDARVIDLKEGTFFSYLNAQIERQPDKVILADAGRSYDYRTLDHTVTQISRAVAAIQQEPGSPIGILMDRSADLVAVILGVMRAGSPYVPLDPDFPQERLQYIIEHSGLSVLIGDPKSLLLKKDNLKSVTFGQLMETTTDPQQQLPEITATDSAYIIYTSGSTGRPKGVEISHRALLNFLLSMQHCPGITQEDHLYSVTTPSFDISILEFLLPLISGAKLFVADKDSLKDPLATIEQIGTIRPTVLQATPSFFQMLFNAGWQGDKDLKVLCGGDLLSRALAEKLGETCSALWNMYGPTETTIWSSTKKIERPEEAANIGRPIANTQLYILNDRGELVPPGTPGTIYIAGEGLAKGYFRAPDITRERFLQNPFAPGQLMYNTGDLGKWNTRGEILFLGRNDFQVKIRGYRIELSEIEHRLNQLSQIVNAVLVVKKQQEQEAYLVAYVKLKGEDFDEWQILDTLARQLPAYMLPNRVIPVEEFPTTANNKIDRKALSIREIPAAKPQSNRVNLPINPLQETLARYFSEILLLKEPVGLDENFFALGGHSLNAVKLLFKIEQEWNYRLSLKDMFVHPTVRDLAKLLEHQVVDIKPTIRQGPPLDEYPLTPSQYHLWLAAQQAPRSIAYNMSAAYTIEGNFHLDRLEQAFRLILSRYDVLRSNFVEKQGIPFLVVSEHESTTFSIVRKAVKQHEVSPFIRFFAHQPFELEKDLLLKVAYLEVEQGKDLLVFLTHHLIADGWSLEILIRELIDNYQQLGTTPYNAPAALPLQFQDYLQWHRKAVLEGQDRQLLFWRQFLEGYAWQPLHPLGVQLEDASMAAATEYEFVWDKYFVDSLHAYALLHNCSLHSLLLTMFNLLFYRLFGVNDLCIGTLNSGRDLAELNNQLGMFVKTLPLRTRFEDEMTVAALIQQTQADILKLHQHQDIPPSILKQLRIDTLFVLQTDSMSHDKICISDELVLKKSAFPPQCCRLPLLVSLQQREGQIIGHITFNEKRWPADMIRMMIESYRMLLANLLDQPGGTLAQFALAGTAEHKEEIEIPLNF